MTPHPRGSRMPALLTGTKLHFYGVAKRKGKAMKLTSLPCAPAALLALVVVTSSAQAGGGPENVLLLIDPSSPNAMHVGNYYRHARNIPDRNVIYVDPRADTFDDHAIFQLDALFGMLANLGIADHIDYIVIPPGDSFYVPLPSGYIDAAGCTPVSRLSLSSAYTLAHRTNAIYGGDLSVLDLNHYYSTSDTARAFDHDTSWWSGSPSSFHQAEQYFIGFMLGYDGERGNTIDETLAMIDRSVAADGTRPTGTFYFMKTTDALRSPPRDPHFAAAVAAIQSYGGQAELIEAVLPFGRHDCLGIMTGATAPDIDGADMTIMPGAFCDHLTSFAGTFDNSGQVKMSRWIARGAPANGASGSMGTVEEPCVTSTPGETWKFPHPRLHVWYYQGVSLGEALFRSVKRAPFQCLFYGDPLTRPFAYLPQVSVEDAPEDPVSGTLVLTPNATTDHPTAAIASFDLYVDGVLAGSAGVGASFVTDTAAWPDGTHDLRIVAYDDTLVASQGRWLGTVETNNFGRSTSLTVEPPAGDLQTPFSLEVSAAGAAIAEIRLMSSNRVVAATPSAADTVTLLGKDLGAGPARLQAVAEFEDGLLALSDVVVVDVTPGGDPILPASAPVAFGYTKDVPVNLPFIVELPATDLNGSALTYTIESTPSQASVDGTGPVRLLRPAPRATGTDVMTFSVSDGELSSGTATIYIRYDLVLGDLDGDHEVDLRDFAVFELCFNGEDNPPASACPPDTDADFDLDGDVDLGDLMIFSQNLTGPG